MGHATSSTVRTKSTGVGIEALDGVGNGDANTAFGYRALTSNTTGYSNTAVGTEALREVVSGFRNTAIGIKALETTVEGTENIAIGRKAMNGLLTATKNIAIGNETSASSTTAENQIIIGHQASGLGDNYAVIGNAALERVYASQDGQATVYAGGMVLEGSTADNNETTLGLVDPTGDNTINLPNASGTIPVLLLYQQPKFLRHLKN